MIWTLAAALVLLLTSAASPAAASDGRRHVCLDPGHGGSDPGAERGPLVEKELNLDIAQRLAAKLDAAVYNVKLTRTDNATSLGNSARAEICNSFGAHVVLSIHLNASTDDTVDYVWFFYGKRTKDYSFTQTMDANYQIQDAFGTGPLVHKKITNFANGTLLKSKAPAALAEGLFMSHWKEQQLLADTSASSRRQQIADELAKGLSAWFR
jgi:N-acetylmuramoyl-L-alanine amidase